MASLDDILSALKNGVTAINNLAVRMGASATIPLSFYGFNNITTSPVTVVAGSTGSTFPTELSFHNPSSIDVIVYPSVDGNGNAITASSSSPGGGVLIYSNGGSAVIDGGSTMAWLAVSTGTASLTVSRNV